MREFETRASSTAAQNDIKVSVQMNWMSSLHCPKKIFMKM